AQARFDTNPQPSASHAAARPQAPPPPRRRTVPASQVLRRSLSPPLFLAVVAVLLLGFVGSIFAIKSRYAKPGVVDKQYEAKRTKERQLRAEAQQLLNQGRVTDAYAKLDELHKISPQSPWATQMMQRLS